MNEQRMQFAIGIVTLIAGFALAAIIIWFGEFQFLLEPRKVYTVLFKDAPGAEAKVPVRRAGIRIGEIRDVTYDDETSMVVAHIVIDASYDLRKGDEPTLTRGLLGDTYLDIITSPAWQGKPDRPIYPPGSTLEGRSPLDTNQALEEATSLVPTTGDALAEVQRTSRTWNEVGERTNRFLKENERKLNAILDETRDSTERLSTALEGINNILDPAGQENIRVTLQNIRESSDQLKPLIEASRKTIEQISDTTSKLDEIAQNLQTATKPVAERSESVTRNLDESAQSLNQILGDVKGLVRQFQTQDGTIQRLMKDPSLFQNLDDASVLMVHNLAELEGIMSDLKVFSDKIARHPGELGVQGVLTKDAGLKNVDPGSLPTKKGMFHRQKDKE